MTKFLFMSVLAAAALATSGCSTYVEYAKTLPQYQAHDPNRCHSNVSVGSLTPSNPSIATATVTSYQSCGGVADDTMSKMRNEVGSGGLGY